MIVVVSEHALRRSKERLGLNTNATLRAACNALKKGFRRHEAAGDFYKYLEHQWLMYERHLDLLVWGEHIYIFDDNVLVTMYLMPNKYKRVAVKIATRRRT